MSSSSNDESGSDNEFPFYIPPETLRIVAEDMRQLREEELKNKMSNEGKDVKQWLANAKEENMIKGDSYNTYPSLTGKSAQNFESLGFQLADGDKSRSNDKTTDIKTAERSSDKGENDKKKNEKEEIKKKPEKVIEGNSCENNSRRKNIDEKIKNDPYYNAANWNFQEQQLFWEILKDQIRVEFEAMNRPAWKSFDMGSLTEEQREQLTELDRKFQEAGIPPFNPIYDSSDLDLVESESSDDLNNSNKDEKSMRNDSRNPENVNSDSLNEINDIHSNDKKKTKSEVLAGIKKRREEAINLQHEEKEKSKMGSGKLSKKPSVSKGIQVNLINVKEPTNQKCSSPKSSSPTKAGPSGISKQNTSPSVKKAPTSSKLTKTTTKKTSLKPTNKPSVVLKWVPPKDSKKTSGAAKARPSKGKVSSTKCNSPKDIPSTNTKETEKQQIAYEPKNIGIESQSNKDGSTIAGLDNEFLSSRTDTDENLAQSNDDDDVTKYFRSIKGVKVFNEILISREKLQALIDDDSLT